MNLGKVSYTDKLKSLSWPNFKKYWNDGNNEADTGLTAEQAAEKFGIKVPAKKTKGGE